MKIESNILLYILLGISILIIGSCIYKKSYSGINHVNETAVAKLLDNYSNQKNAIARIATLKEFESKTKSIDEKKFVCDIIAEELSYFGDYKEALFYADKHGKFMKENKVEYNNKFRDYNPQDALKTIASIANNHQIIFINEAHHVPMHRAFSIKLLKILYDKGFRYFAAETVSTLDKDLNSRGYPLSKKTGIYTDEPLYGDLIRNALKLGYKVVPYENEIPCEKQLSLKDVVGAKVNKKKFNWNCQNHREYNQAQNLYNRILKKNSKAKIFVHAGYGHISKKGNKLWTPMCENFIKISGIIPFTIDQETMREHSAPKFENGIYQYINHKYKYDYPIVFTSSENKFWVYKKYKNKYDLQIFHPRTTLVNGRPSWMTLYGLRTPYFINNLKIDKDCPCIVSAHIKEEGPDAVPIDQITLRKRDNNKALMLPMGKFVIKIKDKTGRLIRKSVLDTSI